MAFNFFAVVIAGGILSKIPIRNGNYGMLFVLLFPLCGLGLILIAVYLSRHLQRFGESVFEIATPGKIGGTLTGTIRLGRPLRPEGLVRLRLSCFKEATSKSQNEHPTRTILWQNESRVKLDATGAIPVAFAIPGDCSETKFVARTRRPTLEAASQGELRRDELQRNDQYNSSRRRSFR